MPTTVEAHLTRIKGLHLKSVNRNGQGADLDSAPAGATTQGASPMEMLLQATGGCTAMDVIYILGKRKLDPEAFEVHLEGIRRDEHPRIYTDITITFRARGAGITVEELERAVNLSMDKYCAAFAMFKHDATVHIRCEVM